MHILLIAIGTRGDVQPFVVLGTALAGQGHEVSIAASTGFREMIGKAGLTHHALPVDFQELLQEPRMRGALTSFSGKLKAYRWASDLMNKQLDAIWTIGLEVRPDLILQHFKGALGPYIARKIGAICVPVMLQPGFMATRDYPQFLISSRSLGELGNLASHKAIQAVMRFGTGMMIRRWRKVSRPDIGPAMDTMQGYDPKGRPVRIHAYSHAIVPRPTSWPESEVQTGYLFSEPEGFEPPEALALFLKSGSEPVYIGFGSMPGTDQARVKKAVLRALELTGQRAIIASGWGGISGLETGEKLHVLDAVPHSWLFPKVAAVVHHGGSGTTHEVMRWGRPSVICPLFADQPFFGRRIFELGAGPEPISQKRLTADQLAKALEAAQGEEMKRNAGLVAEQMQREDGVACCCELVEHWSDQVSG